MNMNWKWTVLFVSCFLGCNHEYDFAPPTRKINSSFFAIEREVVPPRRPTPVIPFQRIAQLQVPEIRIPELNEDRRPIVPIEISDWLNRSSRVDSESCPAASSAIYRGIHDNFAPMVRIVRNMLGDITAEFPSWRMKYYLEEYVSPDEAVNLNEAEWRQARENMLSEFQEVTADHRTPCQFAIESRTQTASGSRQRRPTPNQANSTGLLNFLNRGTGVDFSFWDSYGVASSPSFTTASSFANTNIYYPGTVTQGPATILEIRENVSRAAPEMSDRTLHQFYFPIVIPAVDITAAWFGNPAHPNHRHSIEKVTNTERTQFISLKIYTSRELRDRVFPDNSEHFRTLEGEIVPCDPTVALGCVSDPVQDDLELTEVIEYIRTHRMGGYSFKYQAH